jgi:hypothetical protein
MLTGRGLRDWVPSWMLETEEREVEGKVGKGDAGELVHVIAIRDEADVSKGKKTRRNTTQATSQQRQRVMRTHAIRRK